MPADLKYWVAISHLPGIGPQRFAKLYSYFPSLEHAWQASLLDLKQAGLEDNIARNFLKNKADINPDQCLQKMNQEKIYVITIKDNQYPKLLKEIYSPPALLYCRGQFNHQFDNLAVAVVGTRRFTSYGRQATQKLVTDLAAQNISIVSGLALGIDTLAHQTALTQQGRTIAVLGCGLAREDIYPKVNQPLADQIVSNQGLLLSEYPIGTLPLKQHFPQRNRIVSGLCRGVVIIESPERSGSLITTTLALEQNREVFAVPGNIFYANSQGPHNLIKMGAKLVSSADDILESLSMLDT